MEDSAQTRRLPLVPDNITEISPSLAAVDNNRKFDLARQFQLPDEDLLLDVPGRVIVVIIESDFANGQKLFVDGEFSKLVVMFFLNFDRLMRMNARRRKNPILAGGNAQRGFHGVRPRRSANGH